MKNLSIEEKAKLYDEALERAKDNYNAADSANINVNSFKNTLIDIFPELAESNDEKIRKSLKILLQHFCKGYRVPGLDFPVSYKDMLVWLEKQGEQKPTDKVEPKFKVGDWVVNTVCDTNQIVKVFDIGYTLDDNTFISNPWATEHYHLWTIQDAKDGDVLHSIGWHNDCIFIFNGLDNWRFDEPNGDRAVATGYCCLSVSADNMEFGMQGPDCIEVNTVKPATKVQRDLLFQKMKEVGYEWDAEKKEPKKIEQKPAEWSDEDNIFCNGIISHFEKELEDGTLETECSDKQVISDLKYCYKKNINWLKSLKDRIQPQLEQKNK